MAPGPPEPGHEHEPHPPHHPLPPRAAREVRHRPYKPREESTERPEDIAWGTVNDGSLPPIGASGGPWRHLGVDAPGRHESQTGRRAAVPVQRKPNTLGRPSDDVLKVLGDNITYLRDEIKRARRKEKRREAEHAEQLRQKDEEVAAVRQETGQELAAVRQVAAADRARAEQLEQENKVLHLAAPRAVAAALEDAADERVAEAATLAQQTLARQVRHAPSACNSAVSRLVPTRALRCTCWIHSWIPPQNEPASQNCGLCCLSRSTNMSSLYVTFCARFARACSLLAHVPLTVRTSIRRRPWSPPPSPRRARPRPTTSRRLSRCRTDG